MIKVLDESQLLNLIKLKLIFDITKTEEYDHIDFYSKNLDLWLEAKCRTTHYDDILLEKRKYDELMNKKRSRYIVSTPKGIYSLDVKKLKDIKWIKRWMPSSTKYYRITDYSEKIVTFVPLKFFKDITKLLL